MSAFDYDVLVIGTGPAGEGAAMMATKHGKRVAIIDERPVVGGNCTHMGTIPKAFAMRSSRCDSTTIRCFARSASQVFQIPQCVGCRTSSD